MSSHPSPFSAPRCSRSRQSPSTVTYGRITAVRQVNIQNEGAQAAGTLVGGALGVASGSGQSRSNRALRGVGGAAVGSRLAGAAGSSTGFEYTVLIGGTNTIRITTEQAGLRVGDCVSVERGQWNNIRLASDDRCDARAGTPAPASAVAEADACDQAKQQLLTPPPTPTSTGPSAACGCSAATDPQRVARGRTADPSCRGPRQQRPVMTAPR